ncbi:GNAT family N-acetyltransferase [Actibacterium sp. 188UL27-1]|uniref:GNAT family N-acetyltransferase n=1 Tax=Actibacterium sp. 188UL27-1 TaxID=2786961 RepID=UPI001956F129|nr:GNAT family N-acetyltransferase [Actibacterium sp. 188UL27-1]MBM7066239.1 GNAT family N-acetyltransferase [Actibacterium sp. 188UL27-1]
MPHSEIPVIETDRLILRGPSPDDYPDFEVLFRSRQSRFMGGPLNEYETWMLYAAEMGHWQIRGFGMWAITERGSDHSLGMAGGWFPAGYPEREIAWMIWPGVEGRGIALEAVTATRDYFFDQLGWDGAVSYLDPHNIRSVDLALRMGAVLDPQAPTIDSHDVVYRHRPTDPEAA